MLKFTERPKTPGITSKKTLLFLKRVSYLQVIFVLIWMKQTLIWFNLQRDGAGNGLSNIKDTFSVEMSVLHQSMYNFQSSKLASQVHMMAGQNIKKKYLICQIPIKSLKQQAIPNSSLHNLKDLFIKGCRKTDQKMSYSYVCIQLTQQF